MFSNLQPLDKSKHAKLKFKPVSDFSFAAQTISAPLTANELTAASKYYPVVFSSAGQDEPSSSPSVPLAIFSLVADTNPFVNAEGDWSVPYIPAYLRRYPFAMAVTGESDKYALMIDLDSAHVKGDDGEFLFGDDSKPSPVLEQAQDFLKKHQRAVRSTQDLMEQLEKADVLVPYQFAVGKKENPRKIRGFRVVDTKKLAALDDATLAAWVRNGLMSLIYSHLASMANIKTVVNLQSELLVA